MPVLWYYVLCTSAAPRCIALSARVLVSHLAPCCRCGVLSMLCRAALRVPQVFAMPIFDAAETAIRRALRSPPRPLTLRLLFRSAYVVAVTFTACLLPFFHELMVGWELVSGSAAQVCWCWCWCWCGSTTGG